MVDPVAVLGIAAPLGTLAGSLGGIWLGWWLKSRSEENQWWRDARREAFAELVRAIDGVEHGLIHVHDPTIKDNVGELEEAVDLVLERIQEVARAASVAELLVAEGEVIVLYEALGACGIALHNRFENAKAEMKARLLKERPDLDAELREMRERPQKDGLTIQEAHSRVVRIARQHLGSG